MTLEEAIQRLRESLTDQPKRGFCEERKQEQIQLLVWLESYKTISESYPEVRKKMDRLEEENMRLLGSALTLGKRCEKLDAENNELKRLLKLAVRDIGKMKSCEKFQFCIGCPKENEPYCEWKHYDEAMELLRGEENAEN